MRTVTLDILDDKAINLLKDLETLNVIRIQEEQEVKKPFLNLAEKYSGKMTSQSIEEVDRQLKELRDEWD